LSTFGKAPANGRIGILVGGGPAPGLNSAISSAALQAINAGYEVIGIWRGFATLMDGDTERVLNLRVPDVSRIHTDGGSILATSRGNPTKSEQALETTVRALRTLGIKKLVTIGGDDTAFAARSVAEAAGGDLRVAHVPKTIDNDLPLPGDKPTFGYETARQIGSRLVENLMEDSLTSGRWFFVVSMGRTAGHLALGIGKAAGATLTLIPEEFEGERVELSRVCDILEGAIIKRLAQGRDDGVAVIGEGIGEKLDPQGLNQIPGVRVEFDSFGHIRLAEIPLETILKREVQRRFEERNQKVTITDLTLGYELRCAPPVPFDIDYTRTLGYGAARFLLQEEVEESLELGGVVCLGRAGYLRVLPFHAFRDPDTGRTKVRRVDIQSEGYRVARDYMLRLEKSDLEDPATLAALAEASGIPQADLKARFWDAVSLQPQATPSA
jgi:6-phosphofructokinase 1